MPLPTIIPDTSGRQEHFLSIADIYLDMQQPPVFTVEPDLKCEYRPDAYVQTTGGSVGLIECQRTRISNPKMQAKIDSFAKTFPIHKVKTLLIFYPNDTPFEVTAPPMPMIVKQRPLPPRT